MVDALNATEGQAEAVDSEWLVKAALYEMLSMGLSLPTEKLAEPLAQGEFAAALAEALDACGIKLGDAFEECGLAAYEGADAQKLFHALRTEYTRLFATPKKMGAETAEANINAGLAAARQIVDFLKNGNRKFQVNR